MFAVYLNPKVPDEFVVHTVNGTGDPRYTPDPNRPQTMQLKRPGADIIRTPTTPCKLIFISLFAEGKLDDKISRMPCSVERLMLYNLSYIIS